MFIPLAHPPGHARADFGEADAIIAGVKCRAHFFVMTLPQSDACFIAAYPSATVEAWLDGHNRAFAFFGGVPQSSLYDNDKCLVSRILPDGTRQRTRSFSGLQSHYLFEDRYGRPGKGNDKGNVEGVVGFARRNFMTPRPRFVNWDAFIAYLEEQCQKRQGDVLRGHRESIGERFARDHETLAALPPAPFDACDKQGTRVNSLSLVRYRTNDYSVPVAYGHQEVWIVETYCEDDSNEAVAATPDLITHVEVHKMTVHDGHRLADALDDLSERALTPAVMLGDSHYGSSDNMALTREQNINLVAPARPPKGAVSGRLTLEDFTLNEEGLVLRCPNNVEPVSASLAKAKLQARFDLSICQKCPDILRCPVQAAKRDGQFSRFQYTPARAANQKRRLYEQSDAFRDVYRWRAGIEATTSRLKYQMNLAHLRIRGMPAMRYVVNLRALGLNIRRCAAIAP